MYKWLCKNGFIKIRDTKEKQKKKSDREEKIKDIRNKNLSDYRWVFRSIKGSTRGKPPY